MRAAVRSLVGLTVLLLLAGPACSVDAPARPAAPTDQSGGFTNPVWDSNFPDPMIVRAGEGKYWAYATNGNGANVQTLRSNDLVSWEQGPDALPELARWTAPGDVWAPEVAVHNAGRHVLYYTTSAPGGEIQCVSVAVSKAAEGPYVDSSARPLVCEEKAGGSIDAHPFITAAGERYLYWKNDGNRIGVDTWISVQRLDTTGTKLLGRPQRLFEADLPWEGQLVEAPFVWEVGGRFVMFYSANAFASAEYAVGIATAESPMGPFTKKPDPILASNDVAAGPGHCALFTDDGKVWMVYHAWPPDAIDSVIPGRTMWLSEVAFGADGSVSVTPPTVQYPTRP
jgi:beta-xylosidase